jgi:hypothetical protein
VIKTEKNVFLQENAAEYFPPKDQIVNDYTAFSGTIFPGQ